MNTCVLFQKLTTEEIESIKSEIRDCYKDTKEVDVKSIFFKLQEAAGQKEKNPLELLAGENDITEEIGELSFRISPDSFWVSIHT